MGDACISFLDGEVCVQATIHAFHHNMEINTSQVLDGPLSVKNGLKFVASTKDMSLDGVWKSDNSKLQCLKSHRR